MEVILKNSFMKGMVLSLMVTVLIMTGCKKVVVEDQGDAATRDKLEGAVAYFSSSMFNVLWNSYQTAIDLPAGASYDSSTGWWTFSMLLTTGESADINIQFQDKNKNQQKYYNPFSTYYILMEGESAGSLGTISYDLQMSGVQASSDTLIINGDGDISYLGLSASYEIKNMEVKKSGAYPSSGSLEVIFNNTSVTVSYNGTQNVTATYTFLGISYSFTINLATGDIS